MRRTVLGIVALLFVAGCGGDVGGNYASRPSKAAASGGTWVQLQQQLRALKAGSYSATLVSQRCSTSNPFNCQPSVQTIRSAGSFTLDPASVISELRVEHQPDARAGDGNVVQMRELPDGTMYSMDPSSANTCWTTLAAKYRPTFEAAFRSGLAVLRSADPSYDLPAPGRSAELPAQANALAVVRTLGVPAELDRTYGITPATRKVLGATTVTITLQVGSGGESVSFRVDGRQVAAELQTGADTQQDGGYLATVRDSRSAFSVSDFGTAPTVTAPPADRLAPGCS